MSSPTLSQIIHQEVSRDYRTEIPNIVFEMLEKRLISASAFVLYAVYRRIAGQNGSCWVGKRGLEKRCGLNHKTIVKSKTILSSTFEILNGKSLIESTPGDYVDGKSDTITIVDIWPENHSFFKKPIPDPKEPRGGPKRATRRTNLLRTNHLRKNR